jgi:3-dehydroquinate synthase
VHCGSGLLADLGKLLPLERKQYTAIFTLSSRKVWKHWGTTLEKALRTVSPGAQTLLFDDSEAKKTVATAEKVSGEMVRRGADRAALLIAVGGGVVGDVVGYVAGTYMRGVDYVQVPTTLVAQIDSSIGGKTGVNLPEGKNLIGVYHHPRAVVADARVLETLDGRQYRAGLYEVVKYAVIDDAQLFRFLESTLGPLLQRKTAALDYIIPACARMKARIVEADEREQDLRRVLNFGHTIGHALEAVTGYRRFLHGEAVGWGMLAATHLAERLGRVAPDDGTRIRALIAQLGKLPALRGISSAQIYRQLFADKKARAGRLCFVLPRAIGRVDIVLDVPEKILRETLESLTR